MSETTTLSLSFWRWAYHWSTRAKLLRIADWVWYRKDTAFIRIHIREADWRDKEGNRHMTLGW